MEIDSEKFKSLRELAEIQMALTSATAKLQSIKDDTESYILEREQEVTQAVSEVLKLSEETLQEAESNHDAIVSLLRQVNELNVGIKNYDDLRTHMFEVHKTHVEDILEVVKTKTAKLLSAVSSLKRQRMSLEDERNNLTIRTEKINKDEAFLKDRQEMLERDIKRMKALEL